MSRHAVTVELDGEQLARLERLCGKTGVDMSVAIAEALEIYEDALGEEVLEEKNYRKHFTPEQIAAIEAGIEDVNHGRTVSHAELFTELRAKHGW